jgi:hypothetical protein
MGIIGQGELSSDNGFDADSSDGGLEADHPIEAVMVGYREALHAEVSGSAAELLGRGSTVQHGEGGVGV